MALNERNLSNKVFFRCIKSRTMENIELDSQTQCFVEDAKRIHGESYCYDKAKYDGTVKKIIIICPDHGEFLQTPKNHLLGYGCIKCGRIQAQKTRLKKIDTVAFIQEACDVHGSLYDYNKTEYINRSTKIEIICPIHGSFLQTPSSHLSGSGCPKCKGKMCYPSEWIIEKAKSTYGDKYHIIRLMKSVGYIRTYDLVIINCAHHGQVQVDFYNFIEKNKGCPLCE